MNRPSVQKNTGVQGEDSISLDRIKSFIIIAIQCFIMAISLKKSNANPTSTTLSTQQNQNTHRSNKYFYFTICVLSIMFTLIVFFHQLNSSYAILDYIDAYGKVPEKSSMSDVLGNDGGDKMQPSLVKKPSSDFTVKAVSILGERNSGTNWIYEYVILQRFLFPVTLHIFNMLIMLFSIVIFSKVT